MSLRFLDSTTASSWCRGLHSCSGHVVQIAFLVRIIAAWTVERFATECCSSCAPLFFHQLRHNGFNSFCGLDGEKDAIFV